jgi:hypothetical protein
MLTRFPRSMARLLPYPCSMTVLNLLIIYLACGSPFGVYQLTKDNGTGTSADRLLVIASFLLWPIFLFILIYERLGPRIVTSKDRIESIRSEIENLAFGSGSTGSLFEFREVFYRYAGLVEAAEANHDRFSAELFEISQHDKTAIASKCLSRRNRAKVEFHKTIARNEFVDLISGLISLDSREVLSLAIDLASELNDSTAIEELRSLTGELPFTNEPLTASEGEKVWKPQRSTANIS